MRRLSLITMAALVFALMPFRAPAAAEGFSAWLVNVRSEAAAQGISQNTINKALTGIEHNSRVIELDRKQPEGTQTFAQYKKNVITHQRVEKGRRLLQEHRSLLGKISKQYGVAPEYIVALWGMETSYGKNTGGFETVAALATLAYDGRRSEFFRSELMKALKILDEGHIDFDKMKGSWAGAMGQNQFMPSSFMRFAVDGNNDSKRDIWNSLPDVFSSTANYLHQSGWQDGERWGREVKLSQNIPSSLTGLETQRTLGEWSHMGVTQTNGSPLPTMEGMKASLILLDGQGGPAYLVYNNFRVVMKWNKSKYFATSVGLLADLISG
jgi:membrane-bound lytic murein transglycosylase B